MRRSNKEILLSYVSTLTDEECKKAYYTLRNLEVPTIDWLEFDLVKLTKFQYSKLVFIWGEDKTSKCIEILNSWLNKKNITKTISHYYNLLTWVEQDYTKRYGFSKDKSIKFSSKLDTASKARKYIQSIPKEMRAYDTEVRFLVERFGSKILT